MVVLHGRLVVSFGAIRVLHSGSNRDKVFAEIVPGNPQISALMLLSRKLSNPRLELFPARIKGSDSGLGVFEFFAFFP